MSKPTPQEELYRWHAQALEDASHHLEIEASPDDPQCGWFECRLVKGGPFVPARIWLYSPTDENGDLVGDEVLQCEIAGQYRDPTEAWSWLCGRPISEARFNFMTADAEWARTYAPHEPKANPRQPVDWLTVPTPSFIKEQTP